MSDGIIVRDSIELGTLIDRHVSAGKEEAAIIKVFGGKTKHAGRVEGKVQVDGTWDAIFGVHGDIVSFASSRVESERAWAGIGQVITEGSKEEEKVIDDGSFNEMGERILIIISSDLPQGGNIIAIVNGEHCIEREEIATAHSIEGYLTILRGGPLVPNRVGSGKTGMTGFTGFGGGAGVIIGNGGPNAGKDLGISPIIVGGLGEGGERESEERQSEERGITKKGPLTLALSP